MTITGTINSTSYWDARFTQNWEANQGPNQSRFFARLAIELLPGWLLDKMRREPLSLADWGCAQGDGTEVWASYIGSKQVTGVDFSSVAIDQATLRYPSISFVNEDWLTIEADPTKVFDIVFSSNTLEHFHNPEDILHIISGWAKKAVVLLLPYREFERIDEHFFTFLPENIPLRLSNGFKLVWSRVFDCQFLPNTCWNGSQVALVYAENEWFDSLRFTLVDCVIAQDDTVADLARMQNAVAHRDDQIVSLSHEVNERDQKITTLSRDVNARDEQIVKLSHEVNERDQKITTLSRDVNARDEQIADLNLILIERDRQIQTFFNSRSWKVSRPLRFLNKLARSFFSHNERYALLKTIYWKLPEKARYKLSRQRHAYISRHLSNALSTTQNLQDHLPYSIEQRDWVIRANQAEKIVIIPCGFEFDELVNQRPINSAKYFAERGYFVLFIAWQWSPKDDLSRGCSQVWPNVFQVPLFEFTTHANQINPKPDLSMFIITMPAIQLVNLIDPLRERGFAIVYDIMDEWEAFSHVGQAPWFQSGVEDSLVLQSDYVCAVSPSLRDKFSRIRGDISVIGNGYSPAVIGCEHKFIAGSQCDEDQVVGYFGHLTDSWFDWNLVFDLARNRPNVQFEIIGYGAPDWAISKAESIANVRLLGKVPPKDLHLYVCRWSAGIIPFVEGDLAEAVDPIKIYEYLYFGLPVIVTGIRHLESYPMTFVAESKNATDVLDKVIKVKRDEVELDEFLSKTTWGARFDTQLEEVTSKKSIRCLYAS